jgi:hypothetical protein
MIGSMYRETVIITGIGGHSMTSGPGFFRQYPASLRSKQLFPRFVGFPSGPMGDNGRDSAAQLIPKAFISIGHALVRMMANDGEPSALAPEQSQLLPATATSKALRRPRRVMAPSSTLHAVFDMPCTNGVYNQLGNCRYSRHFPSLKHR